MPAPSNRPDSRSLWLQTRWLTCELMFERSALFGFMWSSWKETQRDTEQGKNEYPVNKERMKITYICDAYPFVPLKGCDILL